MIANCELTYDDDGQVVVIGGENPFTGLIDEFCFPLHSDYAAWSADLKAKGYELVQMTVADVLEAVSTPPEKMQ